MYSACESPARVRLSSSISASNFFPASRKVTRAPAGRLLVFSPSLVGVKNGQANPGHFRRDERQKREGARGAAGELRHSSAGAPSSGPKIDRQLGQRDAFICILLGRELSKEARRAQWEAKRSKAKRRAAKVKVRARRRRKRERESGRAEGEKVGRQFNSIDSAQGWRKESERAGERSARLSARCRSRRARDSNALKVASKGAPELSSPTHSRPLDGGR